MRGMSSAEPGPFVKDIWRGTLKPGQVLYTPAGCVVGVKVLDNTPAVALRQQFFPVTNQGLEDLSAVVAVAPTRVSGQYHGMLKQAIAS